MSMQVAWERREKFKVRVDEQVGGVLGGSWRADEHAVACECAARSSR
jgi:hypothetical protein